MKVDKREIAAALLPGAALALWAIGGWAAFSATLDAADRAALAAMLQERVALKDLRSYIEERMRF